MREAVKALSFTQPWATLVAIGAKEVETRNWKTPYRGPLVVHATKLFPFWAKDLCEEEPFRSALAGAGFLRATDLPTGAVVATTFLNGVYRTEDLREKVGEPELSCGDYAPGRFGFDLGPTLQLAEPIPWNDALGLWDVPDSLLSLIHAQQLSLTHPASRVFAEHWREKTPLAPQEALHG